MSAPEMIHADSSDSFGSDAMSGNDLPTGIERDLDETSHSGATVIIDTEAGRLGGPDLVSKGTGLGAVTPSSESDGDENALYTEGEEPLSMLDVNGVSDGMSHVESGIDGLPHRYKPRGKYNPATVIYKKDKDPKHKDDKKPKSKDGSKAKEEPKDQKNNSNPGKKPK